MTTTYAAAGELLEELMAARIDHGGDALTALFTPDAEFVPDPFATPITGHNGLRAYLLAAAGAEHGYDLAIERHWVSGDTVLAAWHASWTRSTDEAKVRQAGLLSAEVGGDGRIVRLRYWSVTREHLAG